MKIQRVPAIAAIVTLLVHAIGNPHYGFFRDELYFIICGFHPAWGYVDQPPVVPLLAAGSQLFGHSLFLLRLLPAIFAAAGAYVSCLLVVEMGGAAFAQTFAALAYLLCNVLMSFGTKVGPDMTGLWLWPLAALYLLRIAKGGDPRLWLGFGAAIGLSVESKYSVLFFAAAILGGVALTPQRRMFASPWAAAGLGLAAVVALPNFLWQAAYHFPMLELLRNGQNGKNVVAGPLLYLIQQLLITNLFVAPVWIAGLYELLRAGVTRFLGYAYVILIALMIVFHGKHYYPGDVYPILIAAGAVAVERWTAGAALLRPVAALFVACGVLFVPFSLPVLSEPAMASYAHNVQAALHVGRALETEHHHAAALPGDWADMHGWPELAERVARVYQSLPPDQRSQAVIAASNYGEAAAIDFFGKPYGLPPAISGHNNYWIWGTHGYTGNVLIDVNGDCGASMHLFASSRLAARFTNRWGMPYENAIPIMICSGIKEPLATLWPNLRDYM
jgi:hypothetical protein